MVFWLMVCCLHNHMKLLGLNFMFSCFYSSFGDYTTLYSIYNVAFKISDQPYFSPANISDVALLDFDAYRYRFCEVRALYFRHRAI